MKKADLLHRASKDLWLAKIALKHLTGDEFEYDVIGYHIQQAVEKLMKFILNENGIEFKKVHFIEQLCEQFDEEGLALPDWVEQNSVMLSRWATETRYGDNLVVVRKKMMDIMEKTDAWLMQVQQDQQERQVRCEVT